MSTKALDCCMVFIIGLEYLAVQSAAHVTGNTTALNVCDDTQMLLFK